MTVAWVVVLTILLFVVAGHFKRRVLRRLLARTALAPSAQQAIVTIVG